MIELQQKEYGETSVYSAKKNEKIETNMTIS